MSITLRDVLALDVFVQGQAEVVAGSSFLNRRVRWVHLPERLLIAPGHLVGGELVVIGGFDLPSCEEDQREIIRRLAAVPIAALVMELGRVWNEMPEAVIDEATDCRLPLIVLHRETHFVRITEQVSIAIISRHYQLLRYGEQLTRRFNALLLSGASLNRLVNELSRCVGNPVVLEDITNKVVAFAEQSQPIAHLLSSWSTHAVQSHGDLNGGVVPASKGAGMACVWVPVILHGEVWGRLHVITLEREVRSQDRLALNRAVTAVGLALFSGRNVDHVVNHAQSAVIADVMEGRLVAIDELKRSAAGVGVEYDDGPIWAIAVVGHKKRNDTRESPRRTRSRFAQELLASTREACVLAHGTLLSALIGDDVLGFVGGAPQSDPVHTFRTIEQRLCRSESGFSIVIGVSDVDGQSTLRQTLLEAQEAAACAEVRGEDLARFSDLRLDRVLLHIDSELDAPAFVESELGPLLQFDRKGRARLLETLRVFLDANGSRTAAASALGIQRRSLYARLHAIERLLTCSLDDPETRVRLYLTLRSLELLRHRTELFSS
jgi:purine catabolism regulator